MFDRYRHPPQYIWLTELENNSSATCISESNTCPASPVGTCNHFKAVTVVCGMLIHTCDQFLVVYTISIKVTIQFSQILLLVRPIITL